MKRKPKLSNFERSMVRVLVSLKENKVRATAKRLVEEMRKQEGWYNVTHTAARETAQYLTARRLVQ